MKIDRVIFDTNDVISAFLKEFSAIGKALEYAVRHRIVLASPDTIEELDRVFLRSKFERYLPFAIRENLIEEYLDSVEWVETTTKDAFCRDPKDDKFLHLALDGKADCVVTGDEDLLVLNPFQTIHILTPRDYLDKVQ